jgi:hypothetical protein
MITDMGMLPTNDLYYKDNIESFNKEDFIYYRNIDGNQIYMCYNAVNPKIWSKVFNIFNENDIEYQIKKNYDNSHNAISGSNGWFIDQEIMYNNLINYENLKILTDLLKD